MRAESDAVLHPQLVERSGQDSLRSSDRARPCWSEPLPPGHHSLTILGCSLRLVSAPLACPAPTRSSQIPPVEPPLPGHPPRACCSQTLSNPPQVSNRLGGPHRLGPHRQAQIFGEVAGEIVTTLAVFSHRPAPEAKAYQNSAPSVCILTRSALARAWIPRSVFRGT